MKQILLTSAIAIFAIAPVFATTPTVIPANNPGCNEGVLNTTTGSAALEAIYTANTIGTTWYSNGGQLTGNNVPETCTYGTTLVPPTPNARPGYAFGGWTLMAQCSFSNLNTSSNGTAYAAKSLGGGSDSTYGGATASTYGLSSAGDWGVTFSNGYAKGIALCSTSNSGDTPSSTSGGHCWCKGTGYALSGGNFCSVTSSNWWRESIGEEIAPALGGDPYSCTDSCAGECANAAQSNSTARLTLFGTYSGGSQQCSFSSINTSSDGTASAAKPLSGGSDSTYGGATASTYGLSSAGDWGVTFSNGYITGMSVCSTLSSGNNPGSTSGQYCWCKATGYTVTGQSSQSVSNTEWVQNVNASVQACIGDNCPEEDFYFLQTCAADWASAIRNSSSYRGQVLCGDSGSGNGGGGSQVEPVIDEIL